MNTRQKMKHDQLRARFKAERKAQILMEQIPDLRAKIRDLEVGAMMLRKAMDAILISTAQAYGTEEREGDELLGYRIEIPNAGVDSTLAEWVLKTEKRDGKIVLAAMPKK